MVRDDARDGWPLLGPADPSRRRLGTSSSRSVPARAVAGPDCHSHDESANQILSTLTRRVQAEARGSGVHREAFGPRCLDLSRAAARGPLTGSGPGSSLRKPRGCDGVSAGGAMLLRPLRCPGPVLNPVSPAGGRARPERRARRAAVRRRPRRPAARHRSPGVRRTSRQPLTRGSGRRTARPTRNQHIPRFTRRGTCRFPMGP